MNAIESLVRSQNGALEMMKMTLADFTEAEMLTRTCPGANHPLWQVGHLCVAETNIINGVKPGAMPELPAGFADKFANKKTITLMIPSCSRRSSRWWICLSRHTRRRWRSRKRFQRPIWINPRREFPQDVSDGWRSGGITGDACDDAPRTDSGDAAEAREADFVLNLILIFRRESHGMDD